MNSPPRVPFQRLVTLLPLAGWIALSGCQPAPDQNAVDNGVEANEAVVNLPVPRPEPPMDRTALLTAVARAGSAAATGVDTADDQQSLDGRPFEFRIRFGCRGQSPDLREAMFGWTIDRDGKTLRVKATPTISSDDALVQQIMDEDFEAVEGFWVPRPWLLEPTCPATAAVQTPSDEAEERSATTTAVDRPQAQRSPAPAEDEQESRSPPPAWPKVGIAQFFRDTDRRTGRRNTRPYETVKNIDPSRPISSQGYNLVISGRLRALPSKRVIACVSRGADSPPDCVISARIDRVWIEQPESREKLAEWGSS